MQLTADMEQKTHILVVDDDARLRELLRRYLAEQGFIVSTATGADDAEAKLASLSYDLMVLDIMMPGRTGLELTHDLRNDQRTHLNGLPILLLTAKGEAEDRINGFETGADDYLTKPFEPRELLLRINAIVKRLPKPIVKAPELKFGRWVYVAERDELQSGANIIRLTDMEAGLMRLLAAAPGQVVRRETLAGSTKTSVNDRTIDVQVTRLRRRLEDDGKNPRYLVTVRGEGYMLLPDLET